MSPFECCVLKKHWELAEIIVLSGYDLKQELYLVTNENVPQNLVDNFDFWTWLHINLNSPQTLDFISRRFLRKVLGRHLVNKLKILKLPKRMEDLILLADVFPDSPVT